MGLEEAPTHIGVERRNLDPESPGGFFRREHPVHVDDLTLT
jgi:hypothetical protein